MAKELPVTAHNLALQLYLDGRSLKEIATIVSDKYKRQVSIGILKNWQRDDQWIEKRQEIQVKSLAAVEDHNINKQAAFNEKHLKSYAFLREKAIEELQNLNFDSAEGAARGLQISIEGERKILNTLVYDRFM